MKLYFSQKLLKWRYATIRMYWYTVPVNNDRAQVREGVRELFDNCNFPRLRDH